MHLFITEKQINEKATTIRYFMYIWISIYIYVNKNLNPKKLVNMSFNKLIQLLIWSLYINEQSILLSNYATLFRKS